MILLTVALVAGGYLLGSVPFGLLITRLMGGPDPRSGGSGNIGATNVTRLAGKGAGVATLFLDAVKGMAPMALSAHYLPAEMAALVGLAAVAGHCFSVFLGFKGGKGVATALGVLAAVSPVGLLATMAVLAAVAWRSGHVSLGSMAGALSAPLWLLLLRHPAPMALMALGIALIVIWRHRENIARLRQGTESSWR